MIHGPWIWRGRIWHKDAEYKLLFWKELLPANVWSQQARRIHLKWTQLFALGLTCCSCKRIMKPALAKLSLDLRWNQNNVCEKPELDYEAIWNALAVCIRSSSFLDRGCEILEFLMEEIWQCKMTQKSHNLIP